MSVNINNHKIGEINVSSTRTPQMCNSETKNREIKHSVFSTRKSPIMKNIKKVGGYNRSRPPLYEREVSDGNVSSLPVIVNSLNTSNKNTSDSVSPELVKRYQLKAQVVKPTQRLAHLRYKSKVRICPEIMGFSHFSRLELPPSWDQIE